MTVAVKLPKTITPGEYLEMERAAIQKSEYFAGEVFLMAGASPNHNRIARNVLTELNGGLRGKSCEVFGIDQRLYVSKNGLYTYPDVMAVCGRIEFDSRDRDSLTNPVLIVDVLSPSTANYDRGGNFELYRDIPSFGEYVLVHQDRVLVEHHRRDEQRRWLLTEYKDLQTSLLFESIGISIPLQRIYERTGGLAD